MDTIVLEDNKDHSHPNKETTKDSSCVIWSRLRYCCMEYILEGNMIQFLVNMKISGKHQMFPWIKNTYGE